MLSFLGSIFFFFLFIVLLVLLAGLSFMRSIFGSNKHQKSPLSDNEPESNSEQDEDLQRRKDTFKKAGEYVDFEEVDDNK